MISSASIPIELMEILNRINDNINEVKERMARIEAQEHSDAIRAVRIEIESERNERIKLQVELASIKTRLAPIIVGISLAGAAILEAFFQTFHH